MFYGRSIYTSVYFVNVPIRFRKKTSIYKTINVVTHVHNVGVYDLQGKETDVY